MTRVKFTGTTTARLKDIKAVDGLYEGSKKVMLSDGGTCLVHTFRRDGTLIDVWGFGQLDFALERLVGRHVWCSYTGLQQRKTRFGVRDVHTVDVEYDDADRAEVPGPTTDEVPF